MPAINSGDTAWVLASAALVLFMTPGLAVFYGGMVRAKSALNMMMMMSFAATWLIATAIQKSIGFRAYRDDELTGLDTTYHAESAYDITGNSNRY